VKLCIPAASLFLLLSLPESFPLHQHSELHGPSSEPHCQPSTHLWPVNNKITTIKGYLIVFSQWGEKKTTLHICMQTLGEPGRTPLYVGLLSAWGSVDSDLMFSSICRRAPFWGLWQTYMNKWMSKQTSGSGDRVSLSMGMLWWQSIPVHGDPVREYGGGSLTRGLLVKDKKRYIKRDVKIPCKWVSLSTVALLGNLEGITGLFSWTQTLRF